jgi:hypothetical protein
MTHPLVVRALTIAVPLMIVIYILPDWVIDKDILLVTPLLSLGLAPFSFDIW